jgi:putative ABC transport system permease protein
MFKNYVKIAVRNLLKHKVYSFINILGLAVGIAASVLIFLYVFDELNFDRFHEKADRIYRLTADWSNKGDSRIHQLGTPSILARTIRQKYPQAESVTQLAGRLGDCVIRYRDNSIKETEAYAAEPSFFDVFTFPLLKGDPKTALEAPSTVVISRSLAVKLFGSEDPLNKSLEIQALGSRDLFRVTGVVRDAPRNSHFRFEMLVSMKTYFKGDEQGWTSNSFTTYILLRNGVTQKTMEEKLVEIDKTYMGRAGRSHMPWIWTPVPITRIHLYSDLATGGQPNGSAAYVKIFTVVAFLILLIAGINFVNLATARSAKRAREVGIRKIVGSLKSQLIGQFLGESILLSLLALVLAVGLIQAALPLYRNLTGRVLGLPYFSNPLVIPGLIGTAIAIGFLAGLYPAFFLSSFKNTDILKGSPLAGKGRGARILRNGLVVFQFAMSALLIIGSLTIGRQLDHIKNRRLGFDKDHIVVVHNAELLDTRIDAYRERLKQNPDILGLTAVEALPGEDTANWGIGVEGVQSNRPLNLNFLSCDQDFAAVLNIKMIEGRFLSREFPADTGAVVINKKAAEYFGIPNPIGKKLKIWGPRKELTIIGIMDNVYFESLHKDVRAMGYLLPEAVKSTRRPYLLTKVNSRRTVEALADLRKAWDSLSPGLPFEFTFLDEKVNSLYDNDNRAGKIVSLFSVLAIFVSCLGLFGLAAFVTEQRTKEIGVRKVLGARLANILWLLTGHFVKWVVVANLIAWPVGYLVMTRWLNGFAFRTNLTVRIFLVSGLAAIGIAVVTVSTQVVKAALANPAASLKYE